MGSTVSIQKTSVHYVSMHTSVSKRRERESISISSKSVLTQSTHSPFAQLKKTKEVRSGRSCSTFGTLSLPRPHQSRTTLVAPAAMASLPLPQTRTQPHPTSMTPLPTTIPLQLSQRHQWLPPAQEQQVIINSTAAPVAPDGVSVHPYQPPLLDSASLSINHP